MAKLNHTFTLEAINSNIDKIDITPNDGSESRSLFDANPTLFTYSEHLFRDTIEAQITVSDTGAKFNGKSLTEGLPVVGTEDVSIKLHDSYSNTLELDLVVNKVSIPTSDTQKEIVILTMTSEEFIRNHQEIARVKKRYDGRISDHVKNILSENLKAKNIKDENIQETSNNYNFIGNRKKPLYILRWLSKKSFSNKDGKSGDTAGFVFYENRDGFNFKSLDSLFAQSPKEKFIYNDTPEGISVSSELQNVKISKFSIDNTLTANRKLSMGAYNTKLIAFDPFNCDYKEVVQSADEAKSGTTLSSKKLPKLNEKFTDVPTRTTYILRDTGTLPKGDVEEQLQLSDKEIFEPAKILNQATRRYNQLSLYSVDIEIGLDLSYKVGDTVEIELKSLNQQDDGERNKMVGGKYLVMSLRHTLLTKNAVTRLGLVRDSIGRKVESSGMVVGVA
mgnify:FL=1